MANGSKESDENAASELKQGLSSATGGRQTNQIERSVHTGFAVLAQPLDFVLDQKLLTFEFHDFQIIDRGVGQAFRNFLLERLMLFFKFRKVRLHRHQPCLLNQWL
jgi:hypothetical protein